MLIKGMDNAVVSGTYLIKCNHKNRPLIPDSYSCYKTGTTENFNNT